MGNLNVLLVPMMTLCIFNGPLVPIRVRVPLNYLAIKKKKNLATQWMYDWPQDRMNDRPPHIIGLSI